MDHIGIDVHKWGSQICIMAEGSELIEQRIRTEPARSAAVLGTRPRARILIEASTDSESVARCLQGLGHEVQKEEQIWVGREIGLGTRAAPWRCDGEHLRWVSRAALACGLAQSAAGSNTPRAHEWRET